MILVEKNYVNWKQFQIEANIDFNKIPDILEQRIEYFYFLRFEMFLEKTDWDDPDFNSVHLSNIGELNQKQLDAFFDDDVAGSINWDINIKFGT